MSFQEKSDLISEQPEKFIFSDNKGRKYELCLEMDDDKCIYVRLKHRGIKVGEANCVRYPPDKLLLADLNIYDEVIHIPQNFWDVFLKIVLNRSKKKNYRKRGLGSYLLQFVIKHASKKGIKLIFGKVVKRDSDNNPKLLEWYRKHGFEVDYTTGNDDPDTVARIYMNLS
ncbi:GNAT family N-acetyltransferase [Trichocoleus sp. Lan]|uniref:GNAT family N-acetyltransferase n=1 Tax=Cyanophyceae TaxID=3028117 RepID=UPI001688F9D3|nr:GNAT family N-acetyltransferase [Coleofasciculus sp. FACHB-1120]MBD2743806.1 GNAT family N-acetyltransferase [Coleofasciculus sp. FACHB-1120]